VEVIRLITFGAGIFLGTLFLLPVTGPGDILTANNQSIIKDTAERRPERLAMATLPNQPFWLPPDLRSKMPKWLAVSQASLPEDQIKELQEGIR
jgi:hypothetical protein